MPPDEVSLKEYFNSRLAAVEGSLASQIIIQRETVAELRTLINRRFDDIEKRRHELREELELRVRNLEQAKANLDGRLAVWGTVWGLLVLLINYAIRKVGE